MAPPPETVMGAFVRHVEDQIAELEKSQGAPSAATSPAGAGASSAATSPAGAGASPAGADAAEEIADLREVLRLGRHLLEGRQVTL
jgi:ribosomal protein L12E/L44/L45/RPP1/RPP2